jgi:putative peptidoglycan lipid II flippase
VTAESGRRVASGVAASAALVAAITVAARIVGFGRVFVFSYAVGSGCTGAAYTAANQIPNVLFEVAAGGALAGVVVPVTVGLLTRGRSADADRTVSALLSWAVVVLLPVAVLVALLAGPLTAPLLHHDGGFVQGLGASMLVIFAPQIVLYGAGVVLAGTLQAHRRFVWPALAPLLSSMVVIATYVAYAMVAGEQRGAECFDPNTTQTWILAGGTTLGVLALSLPLLWPVHRAGVRLRPTLRLPPEVVPQVRRLALAGVGGLVAQQIAVLATLAIAFRVGGTSVVVSSQFAQAVYLLPYAVLAVPLATVVFPRLSGRAAAADHDGFADTAAVSLRGVVGVGFLGAAALVAVAPAVQGFFVAVDAVKGEGVHHLSVSVTGYAPGLVGFGVLALLTRALFATGHGRAAAWSAAAGWLGSIGFALAFVVIANSSGAGAEASAMAGLGWGNSAGMTLAGILLVAALIRVAGTEAAAGLGRAVALGAGGCLVAGIAGRLVVDALPTGGAGSALAAGLAGGLVVLLIFAATAGWPQRGLARELVRMRTTEE